MEPLEKYVHKVTIAKQEQQHKLHVPLKLIWTFKEQVFSEIVLHVRQAKYAMEQAIFNLIISAQLENIAKQLDPS